MGLRAHQLSRVRPLSSILASNSCKLQTPLRTLRTRAARNVESDTPLASERYASRIPNTLKSGSSSTSATSVNPLNYLELQRRAQRRNAIYNKRLTFYGLGIAACIVAQTVILFAWEDDLKPQETQQPAAGTTSFLQPNYTGQTERLDSAQNGKDFEGRDVKIVEKPGLPGVKLDAVTGIEMVDTGTSTIPHFPRILSLPGGETEEEYTLLGLGVRTVSFLGIEVYVLGYYVRSADLPNLQAALVRLISPIGTSLIPQEKESLRQQLLDPQKSTEVWADVLRTAEAKSAVRIVPTRSTDFAHLRDGWVRGITAGTQAAQKQGIKEFDDESFGSSMKEFKTLFGGRGKTPKGSTVLLIREAAGALSVAYEPEAKKDAAGQQQEKVLKDFLGTVKDERISRLVWLNYLSGKSPSSEKARQSVVNGVMELVERPLGTVGMAVT